MDFCYIIAAMPTNVSEIIRAEVHMETQTKSPAVEFDLNGWVREMRASTGMTLEKFSALIGCDPSVIGLAENKKRRVTPGLVARITYAMMRDDPLTSLELLWSAEMEEKIEIPRRTIADSWVYELKPLADAATPDALALAVHLMKVTLENYSEQAMRRGRRATDN